MKLIDIIKDANRNLLRNKLRSFLTILAIFIGSFSIISTSAIQAGVNDFIDGQVNSYGGEGYLAIASKDSFEAIENLQNASDGPLEYNPDKIQTGATAIEPATIAKLKDIAGIDPDSVQEQKTISVDYITSAQTDKKYILSAEALPPGHIKVDTVAGTTPDLNTRDEYQILLPEDYVSALGYDDAAAIIGQTVTLGVVDQYRHETKKFTPKVVGVIAPGVVSLGYAYTNTFLADDIYAENSKYYPAELKEQVFALTASYDYQNYDIATIKDELEEIGLSAMTVEDIIGQIKSFFDVILGVFKIFGFIALLAAGIGIVNTLFMSVQERTREIGLDKALGMSSRHVFLGFTLEAISLGFWGSLFGIAVSMTIGHLANTAFHAENGLLAAFPTFNLATYTIHDIINVVILIIFIAFIAGTLPARQASRKNPIDALRYE